MGCCCCCLACFCCFSCCPCCWRLDFCFVVAAAALAIPFQQICWAFVRVCIVLPQKVHNRLDSNTHPSVGHPFKNCGGGIRHCFLCFTVFRYFFVFCFLLPERLHINLNDLHAAQLRFQIKLVTHLVIINFRTLVVDFSLRFAACLLLLFFYCCRCCQVLLDFVVVAVVAFWCFCCWARVKLVVRFFLMLFFVSLLLFLHTLCAHTHWQRGTLARTGTDREQRTQTYTRTHTHTGTHFGCLLAFFLLPAFAFSYFHWVLVRFSVAFSRIFQPHGAASVVANVFASKLQ